MAEIHPLEETDYWRGQLRALATQLCRRFAHQQDRAPLVDDLEAEGWIVLCRVGVEHPHVRCKVRQGMVDALALWLWGVTWDQAPRKVQALVSLEEACEGKDGR